MSEICRGQCAYGACPFPACVRSGQKGPSRSFVPTGRSRGVFTVVPEASSLEGCAGLAVDIGTTAVKAVLCRCDTGEPAVALTCPNPQTKLASDVISRIELAASDREAERTLTSTIRSCLREMCSEMGGLAGIEPERIEACVVTGNTTMLHLFAGISPVSMGTYPYVPAALFGEERPAGLLGLPLNCPVYLPPCVSAFIGADITCGLIRTGMAAEGTSRLLLDLGTNGEIALCAGPQILCAATAAGPVFEAGGISCGMPAVTGAIDRVWERDRRLDFTVIGKTQPAGLCASGLLDAVHTFLRLGEIDEYGLLTPRNKVAEAESALRIAPGVRLTQKDIRAFQLGKAAIRAGLEVVAGAGDSPGTVPEILLAGGIGDYISVKSARGVGLVPEDWRVRPVGNVALGGAVELLQGDTVRTKAADVAGRCDVVDLAGSPLFTERFSDALLF